MTQGIQFNKLSLKNFLSFGSQPTVIDLRGNRITVVMGVNHDTGGDESKNGVGKSAVIDSISYVMFGKTIRGISNQKLVNKLARKGQGMVVIIEFDTPTGSYRIERGESPSKLKLYRKDLDDDNEFLKRDGNKYIYDVSRNKNETTAEIEQIIGFDIKLFEFLVANTSESIPFMKLPEEKKREIAERLMGLNLLTERAEELKDERKDKKKTLIGKESALEATRQANTRIERQISSLESKEEEWNHNNTRDITKIKAQIEKMSGIDIDEQIDLLKMLDVIEVEGKRIASELKQANMELRRTKRDVSDIQSVIKNNTHRVEVLTKQKEKLDASICPTCEQHWVADDTVIQKIITETNDLVTHTETSTVSLETAESSVVTAKAVVAALDAENTELEAVTSEMADTELHFDSIEEASGVGATITADRKRLIDAESAENPHSDTITELKKEALQKVDDTEVRELTTAVDHYNYLIELLQSKESFLRKAVIDRWLPQLNGRIAHYLDTLELPYIVRIENDLTMSIQDFGEEFDWGNLSKGQRQRVTIALNLAFQDLFEATNQSLSLLMMDELIDSGICGRGARQAVLALQEVCDRKGKRVFLITHRNDIADIIDDNMIVEMKNRVSKIVDPYEEDFDEN